MSDNQELSEEEILQLFFFFLPRDPAFLAIFITGYRCLKAQG